jgi:hypothetical protein
MGWEDSEHACSFWMKGKPGAWWNVSNDPHDEQGQASPLWAFTRERALNRLSLRTKLNISTGAIATGDGARDGAVDAGAGASARYTKYAGENAYNGRGGVEMDGGKLTIVASAAQCTAHCDASARCDCVTFCERKSGDCEQEGACWRRTECEPQHFEHDAATTPFTVFVKNGWAPPAPAPNVAKGALAYLKHDALGPNGDAAIMIFNPGMAQTVTVDLSALLPAGMLSGSVIPHDLLSLSNRSGPALARSWSVPMGAGEVKALGGFTLAAFAPRLGKKASCSASFSRPVQSTTLQSCFLQCLRDARCENVFLEYVDIIWMEKPPPVKCTLLGAVPDPAKNCRPGQGTLVKKLLKGRPS